MSSPTPPNVRSDDGFLVLSQFTDKWQAEFCKDDFEASKRAKELVQQGPGSIRVFVLQATQYRPEQK
jgi:hypothetical protein